MRFGEIWSDLARPHFTNVIFACGSWYHPHMPRASNWLWGVVLCGVVITSGYAQPRDDSPDSARRYYMYSTQEGTTVFADSLQNVPEEYRSAAKEVELGEIAKLADEKKNAQEAYRKEVDVLKKDIDAAPAATLNPAQTDPCANTPRQREPWWVEVWRRYGELVLMFALMVGLALTAPMAGRAVGHARWNKVLRWCIPSLMVIGIFTHIVREYAGSHKAQADASARNACDQGGLPKASIILHPIEFARTIGQGLKKTNQARQQKVDQQVQEALGPQPSVQGVQQPELDTN